MNTTSTQVVERYTRSLSNATSSLKFLFVCHVNLIFNTYCATKKRCPRDETGIWYTSQLCEKLLFKFNEAPEEVLSPVKPSIAETAQPLVLSYVAIGPVNYRTVITKNNSLKY